MGNLIFGNYRDINIDLQKRAKEILREKEGEIIEFFNTRGTFEKPNKLDNTLNSDKALEKRYYPNENKYNLHLRIYNIPGIFRKNDGFFEIIGENLMIFQLFFNKYSETQDKELYKKKFEEFFDALVQANSKKIYEIIGLNIKERVI